MRYHSLKNRRRNVFLTCAFVKKRLHVGFREHATARRNGVQRFARFRQLIEARGVSIKQTCHLIDESTRSTCALSVHALLDALVEKDNLRVLAAQLDTGVSLWNERFNCFFGRNNLLNKGHVQPICQQQSTRTRNGNGHGFAGETRGGRFDDLRQRGAHVAMVALVGCVQQLMLLV